MKLRNKYSVSDTDIINYNIEINKLKENIIDLTKYLDNVTEDAAVHEIISIFKEASKKAAKIQLEEIPSEIVDNDDGTYTVKYTVPEEIEVEIHINFKDDKERMVPIRGSPYKASFTSKAKPTDNTITGGAVEKHIKKECERCRRK